jgi:hypothetical protein
MKRSQEVVMINQVPSRLEKVFHNHELVLWHAHIEKKSLLIPGVVVHQEEKDVIIRARVEGRVKEITVSPDELVAR